MKLIPLYEAVLATANMTASSDGFVSMTLGGESKPALIKGKRVVLPTPEHLANPKWDDRVAFHPLSENILRGESEVLAFFRHALNIRVNYTFGLLAYQLLTIATSQAMHAKLSPDQSEFLSKVKHADEKTLSVLQKLMAAMPSNQSAKAFVSIFLKRSGMVDGKRYSRVGVVSFPLYQELVKSTGDVYGVKMRVKDRETLVALYEYMVPGIDQPDHHNRGSNSGLAPYMDALMKAVQAVAAPLNDLVELFRNQLDEPAELLFNDEWVETFENLEVMVREVRTVPMLSGNEGATAKGESTAITTAEPANVPAAAAPAAAVPAPYQAPIHQPYQSPQPYQAPYGHAHAPQQPVTSGIVKTARGVDFESLLRSNPALAQQVGGPSGGYNTGYMAGPAGPRAPRWAGDPNQQWQQPQPMYGQPTYGYPAPGGFGRI